MWTSISKRYSPAQRQITFDSQKTHKQGLKTNNYYGETQNKEMINHVVAFLLKEILTGCPFFLFENKNVISAQQKTHLWVVLLLPTKKIIRPASFHSGKYLQFLSHYKIQILYKFWAPKRYKSLIFCASKLVIIFVDFLCVKN